MDEKQILVNETLKRLRAGERWLKQTKITLDNALNHIRSTIEMLGEPIMPEYMNIKQMTNTELLEEYNHLRNTIEGVADGGYGKFELCRLEEVEHEMTRREE